MGQTSLPSLHTFRTTGKAMNLPQTASSDLFKVTGRVKILDIIGEVTTQVQDQMNNTKLTVKPGAGPSTDLCTFTNIQNLAPGNTLMISGTFSNAMIINMSSAFEGQGNPFVVVDGDIQLDCAANSTGQIAWTVLYQQLDADSSIVAA
jgi:hypothetical protein